MAVSLSKVFVWVESYKDALTFWRDALQLQDVGDNPVAQYGAVMLGPVLIEFQQIPASLLQKIQAAESVLKNNGVEIPRECGGKIFRLDINVDSLTDLRKRLSNLNIKFTDMTNQPPPFIRVDVGSIFVRIFEAPNG